MEQIIDIAKQDLDTYEAELVSVGILEGLTEKDYQHALSNARKLVQDLEVLLNNERSE